MLQEQEEFEDTLDHLQITVGGFHTYDNIDKYLDNAKASANVDDKIQECMEMARTFNQREYLVGNQVKDYSRLQEMLK